MPPHVESWTEGSYFHKLLTASMEHTGIEAGKVGRAFGGDMYRLAVVLSDIYAAGFLHGCRVHKQIEREKRARRRRRGAIALIEKS